MKAHSAKKRRRVDTGEGDASTDSEVQENTLPPRRIQPKRAAAAVKPNYKVDISSNESESDEETWSKKKSASSKFKKVAHSKKESAPRATQPTNSKPTQPSKKTDPKPTAPKPVPPVKNAQVTKKVLPMSKAANSKSAPPVESAPVPNKAPDSTAENELSDFDDNISSISDEISDIELDENEEREQLEELTGLYDREEKTTKIETSMSKELGDFLAGKVDAIELESWIQQLKSHAKLFEKSVKTYVYFLDTGCSIEEVSDYIFALPYGGMGSWPRPLDHPIVSLMVPDFDDVIRKLNLDVDKERRILNAWKKAGSLRIIRVPCVSRSHAFFMEKCALKSTGTAILTNKQLGRDVKELTLKPAEEAQVGTALMALVYKTVFENDETSKNLFGVGDITSVELKISDIDRKHQPTFPATWMRKILEAVSENRVTLSDDRLKYLVVAIRAHFIRAQKLTGAKQDEYVKIYMENYKSKKECLEPDCKTLTKKSYCREHQKHADCINFNLCGNTCVVPYQKCRQCFYYENTAKPCANFEICGKLRAQDRKFCRHCVFAINELKECENVNCNQTRYKGRRKCYGCLMSDNQKEKCVNFDTCGNLRHQCYTYCRPCYNSNNKKNRCDNYEECGNEERPCFKARNEAKHCLNFDTCGNLRKGTNARCGDCKKLKDGEYREKKRERKKKEANS